MQVSPEDCARDVLDVVPLVMRTIRAEMHSHRQPGLSVPQFRAMTFLDRHEGASLSAVADHIGLTLPTMSKMIDGLVTRKLVTRTTCSDDRRRVHLAVTASGKSSLDRARHLTQVRLTAMLTALPADERQTVAEAMRHLRPIFTPAGDAKLQSVER